MVSWPGKTPAYFFVNKRFEIVDENAAKPASKLNTKQQKTYEYYHVIDGSNNNTQKLDYLFYYTIIQKAAIQCDFNAIYQLDPDEQLKAAVVKLRETGRFDVFPPTARVARAFIKAAPPALKKNAKERVSTQLFPEGAEDVEDDAREH